MNSEPVKNKKEYFSYIILLWDWNYVNTENTENSKTSEVNNEFLKYLCTQIGQKSDLTSIIVHEGQ